MCLANWIFYEILWIETVTIFYQESSFTAFKIECTTMNDDFYFTNLISGDSFVKVQW